LAPFFVKGYVLVLAVIFTIKITVMEKSLEKGIKIWTFFGFFQIFLYHFEQKNFNQVFWSRFLRGEGRMGDVSARILLKKRSFNDGKLVLRG
jgi:hypothetical protein